MIRPQELPQGFGYWAGFISAEEEQMLLMHLREIQLLPVRMRAQVARRRVAHFGWLYDYETWKLQAGPPIPEFMLALRERAAVLVDAEAEELVEALITEYPAGAGIGWHRDAPVFEKVVAVSLLSSCRLRLRRGSQGRASTVLTIEPRSAYTLQNEARSRWQHSISPTKALRYSVTFRALRSGQRH